MSPAEGAAGYVALTFDDGPYPETTAALLAILRERGAVGTFFVTGEHCAEHPDLLRALADAGMPVANHTWDHPSLPGLAPEEQQAQLSRTQDVVRSVLGEAPALFRPPFGDTDAAVRALAAAQGCARSGRTSTRATGTALPRPPCALRPPGWRRVR